MSAPLKTCTKCRVKKTATLEFFGPNARAKDGLQCHCRWCDRKKSKAYKAKNQEATKAYQKEYARMRRERANHGGSY
jgi:hypothetical protein